MNHSIRFLVGGLGLAAVVSLAILWHHDNAVMPPSRPGPAPLPKMMAPDALSVPAPEHPEPPEPVPDLPACLETTLTQLAASQDAGANRKLLAKLRNDLATLPAAEVSRALQAFLAENKDAATKLDVTINAGGNLGDASSLRVFLLDYLGQIDRPAAGALAAQTLSQYTTPDEWAVSLRNYAWANPDPESEPYLQAKARELLGNPAWAKDPSAGFLEAFDTIVHARGTALAPELATLVRNKQNPATAHAAYLTLDRLTITQPIPMLTQLVEQPDLMQGREQTRANYLARADVGNPEQRTLVERYLLDPARPAQELATFAGLFPNANYMISNNLLTHTETPKHDALAQQDTAALGVVQEWLADPRFEKIKPQIEAIRVRLETFVSQAAKNP